MLHQACRVSRVTDQSTSLKVCDAPFDMISRHDPRGSPSPLDLGAGAWFPKPT